MYVIGNRQRLYFDSQKKLKGAILAQFHYTHMGDRYHCSPNPEIPRAFTTAPLWDATFQYKIELHHGLILSVRTVSQNEVTSPTPSSSASSSHNGMRVKTTRNTEAIKAALLQLPTSLTSFKHGFSGVL
jgi:hypothetical protein